MALKHFASLNVDGGHIFAVKRMDVRRVMLRLLEIHTFVVISVISRYRDIIKRPQKFFSAIWK